MRFVQVIHGRFVVVDHVRKEDVDVYKMVAIQSRVIFEDVVSSLDEFLDLVLIVQLIRRSNGRKGLVVLHSGPARSH